MKLGYRKTKIKLRVINKLVLQANKDLYFLFLFLNKSFLACKNSLLVTFNSIFKHICARIAVLILMCLYFFLLFVVWFVFITLVNLLIIFLPLIEILLIITRLGEAHKQRPPWLCQFSLCCSKSSVCGRIHEH